MKIFWENEKKQNSKRDTEADHFPENLGTWTLCVFFCFLTVILPLYFKNGYEMIATRKSLLFQKAGAVYAALMLVVFGWRICRRAADLRTRSDKKGGRQHTLLSKVAYLVLGEKAGAVDAFVLAWGLVNTLSYLFSEYQDTALWGTGGWFLGLLPQWYFVLIYFGVSRLFPASTGSFWGGSSEKKAEKGTFFGTWGERIRQATAAQLLLGSGILVSLLVSLWGLLNRFSVYPIHMLHEDPAFIASIGNINWTGGYCSLWMPVILGLYVFQEELSPGPVLGEKGQGSLQRCLRQMAAGTAVLVTLCFGLVEGSDALYVSLAVTFLVLMMACRGEMARSRSLRYIQMGILTCLGCQLMRLMEAFFPGSLNYYGIPTRVVLGNLTLILGILAAGFYRYLKMEKGEKSRKVTGWIARWIPVLCVSGLVIYVVLLMGNTLSPGFAGNLSESKALTFQSSWGSDRGRTWTDGLQIWQSLSPVHKILGTGPDTFAAYAYGHETLGPMLRLHYGDARLTNAHNEVITILVNQGIPGAMVFLGMILSACICGWKALISLTEEDVTKKPEVLRRDSVFVLIFFMAVLSGFVYKIFSFEQIMETPYFYMMLGLLACYLHPGVSKATETLPFAGGEKGNP